MPNGTRTRAVSQTFLKLTKIPCAVSGRRYVTLELSSSAPTWVLNIRLNARGAVSVPGVGRAGREHLGAQRLVLQRARHGDDARASCRACTSAAPRCVCDAARTAPRGPSCRSRPAQRTEIVVVALDCAVGADELEREHSELIGAVTRARLAVVDHRIAEPADVAARFPDLRIHQQRAVEPDHAERRRRPGRRRGFVVMRDHVVPPRLLQVALELDAERAVVPAPFRPP